MSALAYLPSLFSTLFRLAIYVFLRVIPTSIARFVLPSLYISCILSSWYLSPHHTPPNSSKKTEEAKPPPKEQALFVLLFSWPTNSQRLRRANVFINTLLLLAALDFVVTPFLDSARGVTFTRVGAVYPDSVKIMTRFRNMDSANDSLRLRIIYREASRSDSEPIPWSDGPVITFGEDNDWVATGRLTGLWPNTSYEYTLSTMNRTVLSYPSSPIRFHTFPDPRLPSGNNFRFVVSSCILPNHPYNGPLHRRTIKGFDLLADYLFPVTNQELFATQPETTDSSQTDYESFSPPAQFLLFLGDFIYADVPVYIGDQREAYRRLYRRNYQSNSFRRVYERLPILHAYDDHEFVNNFGAAGNDSVSPFRNAADAFGTYNSDANYDPVTPGEYYYEFQHGDAAFFVMDTRRHRTDVGAANRTMLGEKQLASLQTWLLRVNGTSVFKFVVTSVPFTSLWGHDAQSDSWAGFATEKQTLLEAFHTVPNLIILSGDRHEFAAIEFNGPLPTHYPIWEISTSPLSMFYIPFFRTLRSQSEITVPKNRTSLRFTENSTEMLTLTEDIPTERVIKYIPRGNYKWSTLEVNTMDAQKPTVSLEAMVDGKTEFKYHITGTPVKHLYSTALGSLVPSKMKDLVEKFGLYPKNWF